MRFESGRFRESRLRPDAHRENDKVTGVPCSGFCVHQNLAVAGLKARDSAAERNLYSVLLKMFLHGPRHLGIKRRHHLIKHFDDSNGKAAMREVPGHFQSDETRTNDDGALRVLLADPRPNLPAVGDCA